MREERLPVNDLSFPDLRAFLDQLRRDGDLGRRRPGRPAPRSGRDSPPRHRRRRPGAPLHERARRRLPARDQPFGTARRAELAFGRRPGRLVKRLVHLAETLLPPTPASSGTRATWRARRCASGSARARRGPVTEVVTGDVAPRPPAGAHVLARGRRAVRHPAARLHRAPGRARATTSACTACTCTTRARPACTGRSARAAASTTRPPRSAAEPLPVTVFLGGPPALILAPSRRCPRTSPS